MDTQVIVVGAGPVGLMLAGELRLGGADVTVVERLAAPATRPRASTLHARTMEILDQRGLLAALGVPPRETRGHFGGLPLDFSALPSPYPGLWKVPQTQVEALLADWAAGLGAHVRRGHELVALTATDTVVRAEIRQPAGRTVLTGAYLVGCDGEQSTVRRLAGFTLSGTGTTREMLHADVSGIDVPDRRFRRYPGGVATAARGADGVTRVMVHEAGRPVSGGGIPSFTDVAAAWARVTGEDISGGVPLAVHLRGDASRQAARYRHGRVLLAGDAAHQQLPVGGQALNLGLQDAANLGWKLAAQATGRAPAGLLDTYHAERHPVARRVLDGIQAQAMLLFGGPEVDATRDVLVELLRYQSVRTHLGNMISGLDVRYGGDGHPLTGSRLPELTLHLPAGPVRAAELLRTGHGALLDLSGDRARAAWLGRAAAACAGPVDLVAARPRDRAGLPDTVLLRPDGHIAWAGTRHDDPRPAMARWFGAQRTAEPDTSGAAGGEPDRVAHEAHAP